MFAAFVGASGKSGIPTSCLTNPVKIGRGVGGWRHKTHRNFPQLLFLWVFAEILQSSATNFVNRGLSFSQAQAISSRAAE